MNKTLLKILPKMTCIPKPIKGFTKDKNTKSIRVVKYKSIQKTRESGNTKAERKRKLRICTKEVST